jgi:hypothetical protein
VEEEHKERKKRNPGRSVRKEVKDNLSSLEKVPAYLFPKLPIRLSCLQSKLYLFCKTSLQSFKQEQGKYVMISRQKHSQTKD